MVKKRATFAKLQREREKERKRVEKLEKRLQRKDDKKAADEARRVAEAPEPKEGET